ncbi:MAG: cob(I)yrinic acid a,c-diamide adenosyltransferase [Chloroflexi bacterium]|nr:cob(I)yrinic acid a,c-diamide adenosyltransferase [Chloroflexota bacterium]
MTLSEHYAIAHAPSPWPRGLVQVYTGDGKGKTTAALGLALRALGHGLRVHVIHFMKGDTRYGEQAILAQLPGVTVERFGLPTLCNPKNPRPEERLQAHKALEAAQNAVLGGQYHVVVLDEINVALAFGLIPVDAVMELIRQRPPAVELVLTGRKAPPELIAIADLVTEMREVKHPFQQGVLARPGIDY